jgi:hypothetical protein
VLPALELAAEGSELTISSLVIVMMNFVSALKDSQRAGKA